MDVQKALLEHFEKLAIGAAGLILLGFLVTSVIGQSPADQASAQVETYNREIGRKLRVARDEQERLTRTQAPPAYQDEVRRALAGGPFPSTFPSWVFYKRPLVAVSVRGEELPEPVHLAPTDATGEGVLGAVELTWRKSNANQLVRIEGYKVFRRRGADGDWREIADLSGETERFRDSTAEPKRKYWYYVESHADVDPNHPVVRRATAVELPEESRVTRSSELGPYETLPDTFVEVIQVIPPPDRAERMRGVEREPVAYLRVYKYFADQDRWLRSEQFSARPGEQVGEVQQRGRDTYDFTTDYELVTTARRPMEREIEGGGSYTVEADVAVLRDRSTGDQFEINNQVREPGLESVVEEMRN